MQRVMIRTGDAQISLDTVGACVLSYHERLKEYHHSEDIIYEAL